MTSLHCVAKLSCFGGVTMNWPVSFRGSLPFAFCASLPLSLSVGAGPFVRWKQLVKGKLNFKQFKWWVPSSLPLFPPQAEKKKFSTELRLLLNHKLVQVFWIYKIKFKKIHPPSGDPLPARGYELRTAFVQLFTTTINSLCYTNQNRRCSASMQRT